MKKEKKFFFFLILKNMFVTYQYQTMFLKASESDCSLVLFYLILNLYICCLKMLWG